MWFCVRGTVVSVVLQVRDDHHLLDAANKSRTLKSGRLTIGRGPENDWVLPDPERVISKQHCVIEADNGVYELTDTSSNGVFVNASDTPVGRGKAVVLKDGDHLRISHFRIEVTLTDAQAATDVSESSGIAPDAADDPFGQRGFAEMEGKQAFEGLLGDGAEPAPSLPAGEAGTGWLDEPAGDASRSSGAEGAGGQGLGVDSGPSGQDYFRAPEAIPEEPASAVIPDDWDKDWADAPAPGGDAVAPVLPEAASPAAAEVVAPAPPAPTPPAPPAAERPAAPADTIERPRTTPEGGGPADAAARAMVAAFLKGAALGGVKIPDDKADETMRLVGALYREFISGLREILAARSTIKSEFRLTQTTIQPVENNPLKFSLSDDDAMTALLTKTGQGYLPPARAVNEAFGDVKAHQVAVMVGMQAALTGLLARFNPHALEERINQESSAVGGLLRNKKSRYWDEFAKLYATIAAEAEDDFQSVFGREFGKAYESQVRKQTRHG